MEERSMSKRLAITISGAVSLGCFEAGVLYEVLSAIKQHNQHDDTRKNSNERIEVDVLTGASAGGMTATIAAQKLMFDATALDGAYQNSFYGPWVLDVDMEGLLALQNSEDPTHSILSSDFVESISRKYLTQRYQAQTVPAATRHAAAADRIHLGLALTNLNGVNYTKPTFPQGSFNYTEYQDQFSQRIEANSDSQDVWEPLRNAAVSCGAFPFAFRMKELSRRRSEYPDADSAAFPSAVETFTYTDGGVFQNEPLGMAKNFVDEIDDHLNVDTRFYLFVAPGIRSATNDLTFAEKGANYRGAAVALAKSIFQQARFHDWITAESVNAQVDLFNHRAIGLKNAILRNQVSAQSLNAVADPLLPLFFDPNDPQRSHDRDAAEIRLKNQFAQECTQLGASADAWIKSILVFETAAGLGDRDEMLICSITAADSELASGAVAAFLGFFDQRYRDHDYDVGRTKAQAFLASPPAGLGPIRWKAEPIRQIDHTMDGLTLEAVDIDKRKRVKSRLRDRAHTILAELGVPTAIIREAIDLALISPQLDKILML
jgi:predicted acylesterase/phospholipase RssA